MHLKKVFSISAAVLALTQAVFLLSSADFTLATDTAGTINTPTALTVDQAYVPPAPIEPISSATNTIIPPSTEIIDSTNLSSTDPTSSTTTTNDTQNLLSTTISNLLATTTTNNELTTTPTTTTTNLLATASSTLITTSTTTAIITATTTKDILTADDSLYPASSTQTIIEPIATTTLEYIKPATTVTSATTTKTASENTKTATTIDTNSTKTSETKDSLTSSTIKPPTGTPKDDLSPNNTDTASTSEKDESEIIPEPVDRKKMDIIIDGFSSVIPLSYEKEGNNLVIIKAQGAESADLSSQTAASEAGLAIPAIIVFDADGDGLTDEIEKRLNTNPGLADTDRDGYSDNEEILNGYNPLGSGKSEKKLEPAEEALARKVVMDQPKTSATARLNKKFQVLKVENTGSSSTEQSIADNSLKFTGLAEPNSVVTLFIYSAMPIVITVNTDVNGNWVYELDKTLVDGEHEAYVVINDAQGKISEKSSPFSFLINKAQAVSNAIELPQADIDVPDETNASLLWYTGGGLGLILIVLITFFAFTKLNKNY